MQLSDREYQGLGAAYLLSPHHDVTLYEKNDYIGGHSRTIDVTITIGGQSVPVDTGFIVFNNWNYPNLTGLFKELNVPYEDSDMSFGVCIDEGWLEYSSSGLFAQRENIFRPAYWKMLFDILKFNKQARKYIEKNENITLGQCLDELKMGDWFRNYYLLAMGAAIWSCPLETIMKFPARTFLQFFKNHGLLNVIKRPQWHTVTGGSREYIKILLDHMKDRLSLEHGAKKVCLKGNSFSVTNSAGQEERYDQVVFACHADEALSLLENPSPKEQEILGAFKYQTNNIVVHHDESLMPKRKSCWASWVYLCEGRDDQKPVVSLSYWMNNLQNFETEEPVIITLNPDRRPHETKVLDEHEFSHPIFDAGAIQAQGRIDEIQGKRGLWFCGAYQRYGFHEDGLWSAVRVAEKMGVKPGWI